MTFKPPQLTVQGYPVRTTGPSYLPRSIQALQGMAAWRNDALAPVSEQWLRREIAGAFAFQWMIGLRLANTPAVEMLPITAEMWVQVVGEGMVEEIDRERIKTGFKQLFRSLKWWPQPVELLDKLPRRPERTKLPEPKMSDEDHAAQARKLQDIIDGLGKHTDGANHES